MLKRFHYPLLMITLVSGGFVFQMPVHAAATPISHIASTSSTPMEDMACTEQGCIKTHQACDTHCVRPSKEPSTTVALTMSYDDQPTFHTAERTFSLKDFHQTTSSVAMPNRAPPSHKLLRSVMKRE